MKLLKTLRIVLIALLIFFIAGFEIGTIAPMPPNAILFVNIEKKEYYAPPCLMKSGYRHVDELDLYATVSDLKMVKNSYIKGKDFHPNASCRDAGMFVQPGRSISALMLESLGLLTKAEPRWNKDGTWNY